MPTRATTVLFLVLPIYVYVCGLSIHGSGGPAPLPMQCWCGLRGCNGVVCFDCFHAGGPNANRSNPIPRGICDRSLIVPWAWDLGAPHTRDTSAGASRARPKDQLGSSEAYRYRYSGWYVFCVDSALETPTFPKPVGECIRLDFSVDIGPVQNRRTQSLKVEWSAFELDRGSII